MATLAQSLVQPPHWAWAVLAYLVFRDVKAMQPAKTSLSKLAIVPAIFLVWGIYGLVSHYQLSAKAISVWLAGIVLGAVCGWVLIKRVAVQPVPGSNQIYRPADKTLLPLLLLTFSAKYALEANLAIAPQLAEDAAFRTVDLLVSGSAAGIFCGKLIRYWQAARIYSPAEGRT